MKRLPKVRWHKGNSAWAAAAGDVSAVNGRRKEVYFRDLPHNADGRMRAEDLLKEYFRRRSASERTGADYLFGELADAYLRTSLRAAAERRFQNEKLPVPEDVWAWIRTPEGKDWTRENTTYRGHKSALSKVKAMPNGSGTWGEARADRLEANDLARLVDSLAKAGYRPNYVSRIVGSIQVVMNWAADPQPGRKPEKLIAVNPLAKFSHEAMRSAKEADRFAEAEEIDDFLAWAYKHAETVKGELSRKFERITVHMIATAAHTGCRPGELRKARWEHFEAAAFEVTGASWGRITLPPHKHKTGRKTKKPREIYLPPEAVAIFLEIESRPGRHPDYIFTHRRGSQSGPSRKADVPSHGEPWTLSALCNKVAKLRRLAIAAGVKVKDSGENRFVMYRLRHTQAANLLMAGVPIATVAKLLGTSVDMIEKVYGSHLGRHLAEAASLALAARPVKSGGADAPAS